MAGEIYFLSSLDSYRFAPVRECCVQRTRTFDTGKVAIEAKIDPPVIGQDFDRQDIDTVIFTCRHEGARIDPINEFPCFVFVAIPRDDDAVIRSPILANELDTIGWGELYRTREHAEQHHFD